MLARAWTHILHFSGVGSINVAGKKPEAVALAMDFSKVDDAVQWNAFQSVIENKDIGVLGA